jgi:3-dehydroquinate synthase class II
MMIGIVGLMISCMKGRETYTRFKAKYSKKETLRSTTPLGEEISILVVDLEEGDEEEVWVEAKDRSYVITAHI